MYSSNITVNAQIHQQTGNFNLNMETDLSF